MLGFALLELHTRLDDIKRVQALGLAAKQSKRTRSSVQPVVSNITEITYQPEHQQ
jgi:hypothetical protein